VRDPAAYAGVQMELTRRFIFRGNAAAFGGRIVRPKDMVLETSGASVLTPDGGRSVWSTKEVRFGDSFRVKSASTFAEGLFDNKQQLIALTHGKVREETLTTTTVVKAEVSGLEVGGTPRLKVKSVRASFTARSPVATYEPSIRLDDETVIDGITIDKHRLDVEIAHGVFQRFDTRAKLLAAADDAKFVKEHGQHLYLSAAAAAPPARRRIIREGGYIIGTIVKRITWNGEPFPGAVIDENSVIVPDFGTIFFGEILIDATTRRLTMIRLRLGSPEGGSGTVVAVDSNGSWT
jgi:hypothetical protein